MGPVVGGLGTILGAISMIPTVVSVRPGMTMFRLPIFTWNIQVTSVMVLGGSSRFLATSALFGLAADRHLGAHLRPGQRRRPCCWEHLFWFFGHPEVYIIACCRSSASSPRSSRCSPASHCSATGDGLRDYRRSARVVDRGVGTGGGNDGHR